MSAESLSSDYKKGVWGDGAAKGSPSKPPSELTKSVSNVDIKPSFSSRPPRWTEYEVRLYNISYMEILYCNLIPINLPQK